MSVGMLLWITFGIVLISRAIMLRERLASPAARGHEWFLSVPVGAGFYEGAGREIYRRYKLRVTIPLLIEAVVLALAFRTEDPRWIVAFLLATSIMIAIGCRRTARWAIEQAKPHSTIPAESQLPPVAVSLETRRLSDYTNWPFEVLINFALFGSFVVLCIHALHRITQATLVSTVLGWFGAAGASQTPALGEVLNSLWGPALALYVAAGCVMLKYALLYWRLPVPAESAEDYRALREKKRRMQMRVCDLFRLDMALILGLMAAGQTWPAWSQTTGARWLVSLLVLTFLIVVFAWVLTDQRRFAQMARRLKPVTPRAAKPAIPSAGFHLGGLVYYNEDSPALLLRGPLGVALNFANWQAYLWVGYLAILAFLLVRAI